MLRGAGEAVLLETFARRAQNQAICLDPNWNWSFSSKGQDPCAVAQTLRDQCTPTATLLALDPGFYYSGQSPTFATECACNKVFYSLLSACGQCQYGSASPWPFWNANCSNPLSDYPKPFPDGFFLPHWALLPLLNNGTVDFASAQLDLQPDVTSNPAAVARGPNVGAIAGGVVGGVAGAAAVATLTWFLLRRRRTQRPMSEVHLTEPSTIPPPSMISARLYDPNDPATYPTTISSLSSPSPASLAVYQQSAQNLYRPPGFDQGLGDQNYHLRSPPPAVPQVYN